jgi:hypothetical protein
MYVRTARNATRFSRRERARVGKDTLKKGCACSLPPSLPLSVCSAFPPSFLACWTSAQRPTAEPVPGSIPNGSCRLFLKTIGEFSPKSEIQNSKLENEVILEVFIIARSELNFIFFKSKDLYFWFTVCSQKRPLQTVK